MTNMTQRIVALLLALLMGFHLLPPAALAVEGSEAVDSVSNAAEMVEPSAAEETADHPVFLTTLSGVNPLYKGVAAEPEVPEPAPQGIHPQSTKVYTTISGVGKELRSYMLNRVTTFSLSFRTKYTPHSLDIDTIRGYTDEFFEYATKHTGVGNEGDYLRWSYGSWSSGVECTISKGTITYLFNYTLTYYTTAAQEKKLADKLKQVLRSLELDGKTEYQKVFLLYDYICQHVTYDTNHMNAGQGYPLQFTAYAALLKGSAVCQGYSTLFYRMALEAGVEARILSSQSLNHAWNLARVNGAFYELDTTWDVLLEEEEYAYFLRSTSEFGHKLNGVDVIPDEYRAPSFTKAYPLSPSSYNGKPLSGKTKNGQEWKYIPQSRTLSISGKGALPDYTFDTVPWKDCLPLVKTLVLSDEITAIGAYSFRDAPLICEIHLSPAVESVGSYAFYNCDRLKAVFLPPTLKKIGKYAFGFLRKKNKPIPLSGMVLQGDRDTVADRYAADNKLFFDATSKIALTSQNAVLTVTTPSLPYNASQQLPGLTLKYGKTTLVSGVDYFLSCQNNRDVGTASVTVTATGRYSGSFDAAFQIVPQDLKQASVTLSSTSYPYNGKARQPSVTVTLDGHTVSPENYSVSYQKNTAIGTAQAVITGTNNCFGSVKASFTILPAAPTLSQAKKAAPGKLALQWKKVSGVSGYRIEYSTNAKFTNSKFKTITKDSTVSSKLTGLKKGTKYYIRVQSFQTVSGNKYVSSWSKTLSAKA